MPDRDDYAADDFIVNARQLLESLEGVDQLAAEAGGETAERAVDEARRDEFENIQRSLGISVDGWFDIEVKADEMSCYADFHPPMEGGEPVNLEAFQDALAKRGVSSGIDWTAVEDTVLRCNTEREQLTQVVVARGIAATDEVPAHIEIEPSGADPQREPSDDTRVDHRERSAFRMVAKGQVLARLVPQTPGVPGTTVLGRFLPFKVRRIASLHAGENTETAGDTVIASCDGRLIQNDRGVRVARVLEVPGDLDYHTGNVDFAGDVVVEGTVKDGFSVRTSGSLLCHRTVGAAEVTAKGDAILRSGFIGRSRGRLRCGGRFEAKFVENGYVEARGSIRLEVGALNSAIHTLGLVETGNKAVIVGGKLWAADGVDAMHLGSRAGVRTEIYCGLNFEVVQKLNWVRDNLLKLSQKIRDVDRMRSAGRGNAVALAKLEAELRSAVSAMNHTTIALIPLLHKNESAQVVARGTVHPGVYIEICHIPFIVQREMLRVRFSLDKSQGKIRAERLLR